MTSQNELAQRFLELHRKGQPLLLPNAWDAGTARLFESLGFDAIATTSSGFAGTLGRLDGSVTIAEAVAHSAQMVAATNLPVSADAENLFANDPEEVALMSRLFVDAGLAGFSIEDFTGDRSRGFYEPELAVDRVRAAVETAHGSGANVVVTARAESLLYGGSDLADVISRLQGFQEAGADVLYAPGLRSIADIASVVESLDGPVNVLAMPEVPTVGELAAAGVARISVGGGFSQAALGTVASAAREFLDDGTYGYFEAAGVGGAAAREAFGPPKVT